jgi:hypothetical protein
MDVTERSNGGSGRSVGELVKDIAAGAKELLEEELVLARLEAGRTVQSRAKGVAAFAVAAGAGVLAVVFGGLAAAAALSAVVPVWAACLIVMGGFLLVAALAAGFGALRMKRPRPMEQTKRTLKEDAEWARARLTS